MTLSERASLEQIGTDTAVIAKTFSGDNGSSRLTAAVSLVDGTVRWSQRLEAYGVDWSCTDGTRFYRYEGGEQSRRLATRELRTGKVLWQAKVPAFSRGLVCGAEAVLTVDVEPDRFLQAWDPVSGREFWNASSLPAPGRKSYYPIAVANGLAYLHCYGNPRGGNTVDDLGQFLLLVEARTGKVVAEGLFNQSESAMYNLGALQWSDRHGLLFGDDTNYYEYSPSLRAVTREARLVWSQEDLGRFALLGDTLVCEVSEGGRKHNYSHRVGLAGVAAATGKVLWRQKGPTAEDTILGTWQGRVVVSGPRGNPSTSRRRYRIAGLAASGNAGWSVEFKPRPEFHDTPQVRMAGERILMQWSPTAEKAQPVLECYRLPR